jgi:hypothetical protein
MRILEQTKDTPETEATDLGEMPTHLSSRHFHDVIKNAGHCLFCLNLLNMTSKEINAAKVKVPAVCNSSDLVYVYREFNQYRRLCSDDLRLAVFSQLFIELQARKPEKGITRHIARTFRFQACVIKTFNIARQRVSEVLFSREVGILRPYSGRFRPVLADTYLFRAWKEHCLNNHKVCRSVFHCESSKPRVRLIDVEKRCVIDSSGADSWISLSYVWGDANKVVIASENVDKYRIPGSLPALPATIEDAIQVTKALGEKYLWVDCLCILQDCKIDKMTHIPKIGTIYNHSVVTIVSASGMDAEAGLPGIRSTMRHEQEYYFFFNDTGVTATLDPPGSRQLKYITDSAWSTRAWTFQERLLSKRILVFTPELVYWECQQAMWREDCFGELLSDKPNFFTPCFGDDAFWDHHKLSTLWGSEPFDVVNTYRQFVSHYTKLQMTNQEDGLNAIAGIFDAMERRSGCTFLWGFPVTFLAGALSWETYSGDDTIKSSSNHRRIAKHAISGANQKIELCDFPSWSWVGWTERIWYPTKKHGLFDQIDLVFYKLSGHKDLELIEGQPQLDKSSDLFWKRPGWNVSGETAILPEHIPGDILPDASLANILSFWTNVVHVTITWHDVDVIWRSYHDGSKVTAELSQGDVTAVSTWGQVPIGAKSSSSEEGSFVAIGTASGKVIALLVSWVAGIVYRRGIAKIKNRTGCCSSTDYGYRFSLDRRRVQDQNGQEI